MNLTECECAWSPLVGWIVCRACCNSEVDCGHLLADLERELTGEA